MIELVSKFRDWIQPNRVVQREKVEKVFDSYENDFNLPRGTVIEFDRGKRELFSSQKFLIAHVREVKREVSQHRRPVFFDDPGLLFEVLNKQGLLPPNLTRTFVEPEVLEFFPAASDELPTMIQHAQLIGENAKKYRWTRSPEQIKGGMGGVDLVNGWPFILIGKKNLNTGNLEQDYANYASLVDIIGHELGHILDGVFDSLLELKHKGANPSQTDEVSFSKKCVESEWRQFYFSSKFEKLAGNKESGNFLNLLHKKIEKTYKFRKRRE